MRINNKKSIKCSIFIIFLLCFLLPSCLFAQRAGLYIGKIDLYTLAMLHPTMIQFDPQKKAFKINRNSVEKQKVVRESKEIEEERRKLTAKMKSFKARIDEEENRFNKEMVALRKKYIDSQNGIGTGTIELNKKKYKQKTDIAFVTYQSKLNQLYGEYSVCEEKLDKLDFKYDEKYTTPEETNNKFLEIINEIKAYTKRIADQKGISIVLNSGYKKIIPITNRKNNHSFQNNDLASIFAPFFTEKLSKDEKAVKGYYLGIDENVNIWVEKGRDFFGDNISLLIDNDIIIGGVDLTVDVLAHLYKNYKLDSNISNAVLTAIKKKL